MTTFVFCILVSLWLVCAQGYRLGAFNIQIFGVSKMERAGVPAVLVDIITAYDIVLVQEESRTSSSSDTGFLWHSHSRTPRPCAT